MDALANMLSWPGGLSQTDIFGLTSGAAQTTSAGAAYNQAAYYACLQMKQNQIYQDKNYHLSWVATARGDIRSVMQASTNRMNNYILVGTLILQTAIGMLWGDNLAGESRLFIMAIYWLTMALSILFFTVSVLLSVKGMNSAFLNTMRLLTWETRPENPAAYDYDYMKQTNCFEHHGLRELFRMPGVGQTHFHESEIEKNKAEKGATATDKGGTTGATATDKGGTPKEDPDAARQESSAPKMPHPIDPTYGLFERLEDHKETKLENLKPQTDQLLYFARMCQFMQIWQTHDTHSKYCLGLGLILMIKGSIYWCLGQLIDKATVMADTTAIMMMVIFTFVLLVMFQEVFTTRNCLIQLVMYLVVISEPVSAVCAVLLRERWTRTFFQIFNILSQALLFVVAFVFSKMETKRPEQLSSKYMVGPAGQRFSSYWDSSVHRGGGARAHGAFRDDSDSDHSGWSDDDGESSAYDSTSSDPCDDLCHKRPRTRSYASDEDDSDNSGSPFKGSTAGGARRVRLDSGRHTPGGGARRRRSEEKTVADIHRKVSRLFRSLLVVSMAAWVAAFVAIVCYHFQPIGVWLEGLSTPVLPTKVVPMTWQSPHFKPSALGCAQGKAFAANSFVVVELDLASGTSQRYPCRVNRTIRDVTAACDGEGDCRPLVLLNDSRVVDCRSGADVELLQTKAPLLRFSLSSDVPANQRSTDILYNQSLMGVTAGGRFVEYQWRAQKNAFAPLWQLEGPVPTAVNPTGCAAGTTRGKTGCQGGRRLRVGIRRVGRGASTSWGERNRRRGILQRSGRQRAVVEGEDRGDGTSDVQVVLQNIALVPDGMYVFAHVQGRRGFVNHNLVELYHVPTLEVLDTWHLSHEKPLLSGGCALDEETLLVLEGDKLLKASVSVDVAPSDA